LNWATDALQAGASQFEASAGKLKRKFWWKNMKVLHLFSGYLSLRIFNLLEQRVLLPRIA